MSFTCYLQEWGGAWRRLVFLIIKHALGKGAWHFSNSPFPRINSFFPHFTKRWKILYVGKHFYGVIAFQNRIARLMHTLEGYVYNGLCMTFSPHFGRK